MTYYRAICENFDKPGKALLESEKTDEAVRKPRGSNKIVKDLAARARMLKNKKEVDALLDEIDQLADQEKITFKQAREISGLVQRYKESKNLYEAFFSDKYLQTAYGGQGFAKYNDPSKIKNNLSKHILSLGFEGIFCDNVDIDADEGIVNIEFGDSEGDNIFVTFLVDEGNAMALISDDDEDEEDEPAETYVFELSTLMPPLVDTERGQFINFSDLSWLNKSALKTMFQIGEVGLDKEPSRMRASRDAYGYVHRSQSDLFESEKVDESRMVRVIRNGKPVRIPVVRKVRRKRLTPKMRMGIRKAVLARRKKKAITKRKFKRSLRIRKSQSIKTPKLTSRQKLAGRSNQPIGKSF